MIINPETFPIKGDISRNDFIVLHKEALHTKGPIWEFGIGGSTIALGLSYTKVFAFENVQSWINRVERNKKLYEDKLGLTNPMDVKFVKVDYNGPWESQVQAVESDHPTLVNIDCWTPMRGKVLDFILKRALPGDVILLHDTRSFTPHQFIGEAISNHFNKIDYCAMNVNDSNTTKIVVKKEVIYVNWNQTEKNDNRVDWANEDTGL